MRKRNKEAGNIAPTLGRDDGRGPSGYRWHSRKEVLQLVSHCKIERSAVRRSPSVAAAWAFVLSPTARYFSAASK